MTDVTKQISPFSEYIQHHLVHLNNIGKKQDFIAQLDVVNYDSLFWSIFMGFLMVLIFSLISRRCSSNVPNCFQAFLEMIIEMVDLQVKSFIKNPESREFITPFSLTIFFWIIFMNSLDLLPVDLIPWIATWTGLGANDGDLLYHHRILPTADLNISMGMSFGVIILVFYYNLKIKRTHGFIKELLISPFHANKKVFAIMLFPINLFLNLIEYIAKSISLGMRLFGNMFAGELIFMLIALLGGTWTGFDLSSLGLGLGHVFAGLIWGVFHILIVILQAFIFMMLTLVYIGQAHECH